MEFLQNGQNGSVAPAKGFVQSDQWQKGQKEIYVVPTVCEDALIQCLEATSHCKWRKAHGKNPVKSIFSCNRGRESRGAGRLRNRNVSCNCPFSAHLVHTVDNITVIAIVTAHAHGADEKELLLTETVDSGILRYVQQQAREGVPYQTIYKKLVIAALQKLSTNNALLNSNSDLFVSRRWLPTPESIRKIVARTRCGPSSVNDWEAVQGMVRDNPGWLSFLNPYDPLHVEEGVADAHLNISIMTDAGTTAYKRFGANGLLVMDGTYKTNKYGFVVHTLMAVDITTAEPHVVGHLLTSDMSHISLSVWLRKIRNLSEQPPKEFLVDKGTVEKSAVKAVFPESHYRICLFHAKKAMLEEVGGTKAQRSFVHILKVS